MTDQELEDLSNLVKSPGWQRFEAYARRESTEGIESLITTAMDNLDEAIAVGKMRQAIAAKRLMDRLLRYPQERIKSLTPYRADDRGLPPSRRGAL